MLERNFTKELQKENSILKQKLAAYRRMVGEKPAAPK
jgi:hypothetical protein